MFSSIIKKIIPISPENKITYSNNVFNISYGSDQAFIMGTGISIASILLHNKNISFHFHVFTDAIDDVHKKLFSILTEKYKTKITIYLLESNVLTAIPTNKLWSSAIYFRFVIADYFYDKINKIVYLDSDIICKSRLDFLFTLNIENYTAAAVKDRDQALWEKRAKHLGNPKIRNGYFNSGVIIINTLLWHNNNITKKSIDLLSQKNAKIKYSYYDQDVLNIVLAGNVLFLDKKYNTQFSINYELKKITTFPINDDTVFIHYIGATKPWHSWSEYKSTDIFNNVKKNSPWMTESLIPPSNSTQYRYAAKHMINKNKILKGFFYYLKYFKSKIF